MTKTEIARLQRVVHSKDVRDSLCSFLESFTRRKLRSHFKREAKEKQERLAVKKETRRIWKEGAARAAGVCDCGCGKQFDLSLAGHETLDHFDNGTGKTNRQKLLTCWKLRWDCHIQRQLLIPGTAYWNAKFRAHCERHNIFPVFQHIEHAPLARKLSRASGAGAGSPLPSASVPDARDLSKVNQ